MGAEQLAQGTRLGTVTLSWFARRMLRLLLLRRRFGTAMVYFPSLKLTDETLAAQPLTQAEQGQKTRIDRLFVRGVREGARA